MQPRTLDFADHRRDLGENRYIYAVVSRRAGGLSIGINLNPDKVCNFDCPYCQVDRTVPGSVGPINLGAFTVELIQILTLAKSGALWSTAPFDTAAPEHRRVADIAFAGDGEPTTAREFFEACRVTKVFRDQLAPGVPIRVLTNATMLHRPRVRNGLRYVEDVWCKLDAGTAGYFAIVDGTKFPFKRVLDNLAELAAIRPIVIQSMFQSLGGVVADDVEIAAWVARLVEISRVGIISEVQVYTVARKPSNAAIVPVGAERLAYIGDQARAAGFNVTVV